MHDDVKTKDTSKKTMDASLFRKIPQVNDLALKPHIALLEQAWTRGEIIEALRAVLDDVREGLKTGAPLPDFDGPGFAALVEGHMAVARAPSLQRIINATGIVIHTNLGRSPLAPAALEAIQKTAAGYTNIEMTLATGQRGSRYDHVRELICELTGAQDAIVVNNCAAAVTLVLATFAKNKEVVVSRGELIEIGGSFRVPDIIAQNGATLREVGTTNKTKLSDYELAITDQTSVLLKTHTSNYRIVGFTQCPARAELAQLANDRDLLFVEDLGSGTLIDLSTFGIGDEPTVRDTISAGTHLVTFSGDKLLGGPQCGIIAGRKDLIADLKKNALLRAMRIDKLSLAALEATLRLYKPPFDPAQDVPTLRMLTAPLEHLEADAHALCAPLAQIDGVTALPDQMTGEAGGGSLPAEQLPSYGVRLSIEGVSAQDLLSALREQPIPIIARIHKGDVLLDVRTVQVDDTPHIVSAVQTIAAS